MDLISHAVHVRHIYSLFKSSEPACEAGAVIICSILHEGTEAQSLCNCVKVTRPGNAEPG